MWEVKIAKDSARHPIDGLIAPRSVALVGASERNHYSNLAMRSLRGLGFPGAIHLVNLRAAPAYGLEAVTRCTEIGEPVDAAFLCVPRDSLMETARDAIAAGIGNLVVIPGGFAEVGGDGAALEADLKALCQASGVRVLGPNCLGFRNYLAKVALGSMPFAEQQARPMIGMVSASGAVAVSAMNYGIQQGAGFTHAVSTGNEMDVGMADVIDYFTGLEDVRAIALFIEAVRDPAAFEAAARKARAAGKPVVALKVGAAPTTEAIALAHTGARVGQDGDFDALCERHAIVRVDTVEALVNTSAILAAVGPLTRPGVALVSVSGGICEIASDYGARRGVVFPQFAERTRQDLAARISDLGQMHNPLDLTGTVVRDIDLWTDITGIIARDPQIGLLLVCWDVPMLAEPSMPETLARIAEAVQAAAVPALVVNNVERPVNEHGRAWLASGGQHYSPAGLAHALDAVGHLCWWSERMARAQ